MLGLHRRFSLLVAALLGAGLVAAAQGCASAASAGSAGAAAAPAPPARHVAMLEIDGAIGPATADHIERGLIKAGRDGAIAVVLRLDTPGGLDAATRDINEAILGASVPVVVFVAPEGARAASAGTYILYASHIAAMAPATSLGAATPVSITGASPDAGDGDRSGKKDSDAEDEAAEAKEDGASGKTADKKKVADPMAAMGRKVTNDAAAYIRSLAQLRGRDAEFAEAAVRDAETLTSREALARGVIDLIATDLDDLLARIDGRKVTIAGAQIELHTRGAEVRRIEPDWRTKLLAVITHPTVAYLLLLIGLYGLVFEGYSPGAILPGVVGAICLLLALYALQVLPINYAGLALILLGVALIVAEIAVPSVGALGIGGIVALVFGSIMLFDVDVPGYGVSRGLIFGIAASTGLAFAIVLHMAARARGRPVTTGASELLGQLAVAVEDFQGHGHVRIRGEIWQALATEPVRREQAVRVLAIDGLTLRVEPATNS